MKLIKGAVLGGILAVTCLGGAATPAQASPCTISGGPFSGRNCLWVVICAQEFATHQNPGTFASCVD